MFDEWPALSTNATERRNSELPFDVTQANIVMEPSVVPVMVAEFDGKGKFTSTDCCDGRNVPVVSRVPPVASPSESL